MFFEKSVKVAAADVEVVCDICHCDIQKRTFFDVIHSLGNVKIIVGFHGGVGSMKFFLQHGDDSVKTALDISFVGRRQLGMGHHFTDRFRIGNYRSKLLNRIFQGEMTVFGKCGSIFTVKTDPGIGPGIRRLRFIKRADNWRDKEALSGFQGIFPVIDVEIALSFQNKMYGIIAAYPWAVGLIRRTFFPAAGNQMKFF